MIWPRRITHRGSVVAAGFIIDESLVGTAEARRRALAIWSIGAQVRRLDSSLIVVGIRPRRVRTEQAPGAPLVENAGVLTAMPIEPDERDALSPAAGTLVVATDGEARVVPLSTLPLVDLTAWLDLDGLNVVAGTPLAAPPTRASIPAPPVTDVRKLTGAPPARGEIGEVTRALAHARSSGGTEPSPFARLVGWLSARFRSRATSPPSQALVHPSLFERVRARLAAAVWNSRLGAALGRKHAAYLRRVLELFDRGDIEEALRHAIPLGGGGDAAKLGLALPRPRQTIALSLPARRSGSVIPVADVAMTMMRERYRAAAQRLEQTGRIDEAAFVLADLLADVGAAISLLERHGKFELAAQLAEARQAEAGLIVRLWFLAGNGERAMDVARRTRAWADAIARLERAKDPRAAVLRMLWADHLAESGDLVQAVDVAWPVEPSRALVATWIDRGISVEGPAGARLLVKKLVVAPAAFAEVTPRILAVLDEAGLEGSRARRSLITELVAAPTSAELRTIARPALRALLRDCADGAEGTNSDLLKRLVRFADDAALRADQPTIAAAPRKPTLLERDRPLELRWGAADAGALPLRDAAFLPDGRIVVALGELGVRVIGRTGRVQAHIDQPATRLVVSDHGTRALAIAPRGHVQRIACIDLVDRRGVHWCDAELDSGASTFDGDLWLTTRGRQVCAIDTTGPRWRAVWGIEVEHPSCSVRREGTRFAVEAIGDDGGELWFYNGFTLGRRQPWQPVAARAGGALPGTREWFALTPDGLRGEKWRIAHDDLPLVGLDVQGPHIAVAQGTPDGTLVTVSDYRAARAIVRVFFEGASLGRIAARRLRADDRRRSRPSGRDRAAPWHTPA